MSKHRHSKDKMHLTYSEIQEQKMAKNGRKMPFERLPFYCCSLSLAPFEDPVCTPEGNVFDILYIMPFIKKYQRNPVTGKPLKTSELIKMYWTRSENPNAIYEYQDPISYKIFTESTHIVCIRTSGYVYTYDTINELNKKTKNYVDLMTNEPFKPEDIITIQDPKSEKLRKLTEFDYIKNNLPFVPPEKLTPHINETDTIARVLEKMDEQKKIKKAEQDEELERKRKRKEELQSREDVKSFIQWSLESKIYKHDRETDFSSASLTSTSFTPNRQAVTAYRDLKAVEVRDKIYNEVRKGKMKGYVQIVTNLGLLNFIVHADLVCRTAQNFIELVQSGYFNNTEFHRLVKNFCLQGGDPTGTGTGGQSIYGLEFEDQFHPKLSHSKTGILSMANSGPNTNRSQFFITLAQCKHLDNKHSVFGEIVSDDDLLHRINRQYSSTKGQKPKSTIMIEKIICYQNPFRKVTKKLRAQYEESKKDRQLQNKQKLTERWIENKDTVKFELPFKSLEEKQEKNKNKNLSDKLLHDYF